MTATARRRRRGSTSRRNRLRPPPRTQRRPRRAPLASCKLTLPSAPASRSVERSIPASHGRQTARPGSGDGLGAPNRHCRGLAGRPWPNGAHARSHRHAATCTTGQHEATVTRLRARQPSTKPLLGGFVQLQPLAQHEAAVRRLRAVRKARRRPQDARAPPPRSAAPAPRRCRGAGPFRATASAPRRGDRSAARPRSARAPGAG